MLSEGRTASLAARKVLTGSEKNGKVKICLAQGKASSSMRAKWVNKLVKQRLGVKAQGGGGLEGRTLPLG